MLFVGSFLRSLSTRKAYFKLSWAVSLGAQTRHRFLVLLLISAFMPKNLKRPSHA